jgi:ATP-dependent DNA ligase
MSTFPPNAYRQKYQDLVFKHLETIKFDLFQIKYDGIWCRVEIDDGLCRVFSRTDKLKTEFTIPDKSISAEVVGEYMFGSERAQTHPDKDRIMLFDLYRIDADHFHDEPYKYRYRCLFVLSNKLTERFGLVSNFKFDDAEKAWSKLRGTEEGLVFRNFRSRYNDTVHRCKYEEELTVYCKDIYRGQGRLENTLGYMTVSESPGGPELMRVGGGFSDAERDEIFELPDQHINRALIVKGKGVFASGALRHPNFVRWV